MSMTTGSAGALMSGKKRAAKRASKGGSKRTTPPSVKTALDTKTGKEYHFARLGAPKRFAADRPPTNAHRKGRYGTPI